MKKLVLPIMTMLLSLMLTITAFAETTSNDVWMKAQLDESNSKLMVSIETNGKTTDGLLTITYDPDLLSFTEEDVKPSSDVDMHSVNVIKEGMIKIAYLAGEPIAEGTFLTVNFTVKSEYVEDSIKLTGEAFNEDGAALIVGNDKEESTEPSTEPSTETSSTETSTETQTDTSSEAMEESASTSSNSSSTVSTEVDSTSETQTEQDGADTGDHSNMVLVLLAISCGVMLTIVTTRKVKVSR